MAETQRYRLVTRSDFDGLVCAVLLKELDMIDEILFTHPKEMQDRKIEITPRDIIANLPYVEGCFLAFDHHESEAIRRAAANPENCVLDPTADSAARVLYNYYGGQPRFPNVSSELMAAVDKGDAARFEMDEVLAPTGWVLLNFIMDARTGLGRFKDYRISNYQLMMQLIDLCRTLPVEQILQHPDVKERVDLYRANQAQARDQIRRCATVHANVVVLDLRREPVIHPTNRFLLYALFPECNISIHTIWGRQQHNTVFAIGASIFNQTSATNIGELCLKHGGGGHASAGTCQVPNERADELLGRLIEQINAADCVPSLEVSGVAED